MLAGSVERKGGTGLTGTRGTLLWRAAAGLVVVIWAITICAAWLVTARAGDEGIWLQASSFAPRPQPAPGEPVRIVRVGPSGPAAAAGIREGDLLVSVDGTPASDTGALQRVLFTRIAGSTSLLTIRPIGPNGQPGAPRDVPVMLEPQAWRPGALSLLITYTVAGIVTLVVVVPLALIRPREMAARVLLLAGGCGALWQALDCFYGGLRERWLPLGWDPIDQFGYLVALTNVIGFLHLFLIFPASRRLGRSVILALYCLPLGLAAVLFALHQSPVALLWSSIALVGLAAIGALAHAYVRPATPIARAQVRWIVTAVLIVVLVFLAGPVLETFSGGRVVLIGWLTTVSVVGLFYVALALAVLRYRLFDVNLVLRATLLYPLLVALLVAGYVATSFALGWLAARLLGDTAAADPAVRVAAALLVAAAFHPLRVRLQDALDRVVNHERRTLQRYLSETRASLSRARPVEEIETLLTTEAVRALGLTGAWLIREPGTITGATNPTHPRASQARTSHIPGTAKATLNGSDLHTQQPAELVVAGAALLVRMREMVSAVVLTPLDIAHTVTDLAPDTAETRALYEAGARLLVPLRAEEELIGIWALGNRRSLELPDRLDLHAIEAVADQAAVLLDYARLHEANLAARLATQRHVLESEFTAMVSHELHTPIRAIKGFSAALLEGDALIGPSDRRQALAHIGEASDELLALVSNLLDMSLMQAGTFAVDPRPTEAATLIEAAARQMRAARPSHAIEIALVPGLPPVLADRRRAEQVLRNLLDNATKYAPGGTTVRISVTRSSQDPNAQPAPPAMVAEEDEDALCFTVSDEGAGIPAGELPDLFDRYRRGRTARLSTISGSGLGLAISRHLVEAHGGHIWAESPVPGRAPEAPPGTRVSFTLPVATSPVESALATPAELTASPAAPTTSAEPTPA